MNNTTSGGKIFLMIRALLTTMFIPIIVLLAGDIVFPNFLPISTKIVVGTLLVLIGIHLLMFRKEHSEEHLREMKEQAENGPNKKLFVNYSSGQFVHHLYAYGGVILLFLGLISIFSIITE